MEHSTELTRRAEVTNRYTKAGFRIEFVCPDYILLCKPKRSHALHIVRVDNGGYAVSTTLSDFLTEALNYGND